MLFVVLLFLGALFWANARDPFLRQWFTLKTADYHAFRCVSVLPKPIRKYPVILYAHGSGGSLMNDGKALRQMAELGLAVVSLEYNQTNEVAFTAQFETLLRYVARQKWADTNAIAWVGSSLGAQRTLAFALKHPELQPRLLIRIAGGWVPELDLGKHSTSNIQHPIPHGTNPPAASTIQLPPVLLFHGEQDGVFPLAEAQRVALALQTNGVTVELNVFPGQSHTFDENRGVLFRLVAEQCLARLRGTNVLDDHVSNLSWQARATPLWLCGFPAFVWALVWFWFVRQRREKLVRENNKPDRWGIALRWLAGIVAALAIGQTTLHLIPPHLPVSKRTLSIARKHLLQSGEQNDFDFLAANPIWLGKPLKTLLEHVELANYNRELVNWKLDDQMYRDYVLSPEIDRGFNGESRGTQAGRAVPLLQPEIDREFDGDLRWRRVLWENFYPRIRRENDPLSAAEIVVRFLRERVTIAVGANSTKIIGGIWQHQITNARGFEAVYVAALRSVGVPARLSIAGMAECWTGSEWKPAPRPMTEAAP